MQSLTELITFHATNPTQMCSNLSMRLNGVADPAVNGGISKYEKAFLSPDNPLASSDWLHEVLRLKELFACQIPLIELGVQLHQRLVTEDMMPFHEQVEDKFQMLKEQVEAKYGKRVMSIDYFGLNF